MATAIRDAARAPCDLILRFPAKWRGVVFFGTIGLLHAVNVTMSFWQGHYEAYLSILFGGAFLAVAAVCFAMRSELAVRPSAGELRLTHTLFRVWARRSIPFEQVHAVRVYTGRQQRVEILCDDEEIECPPTAIPRQEALCLALAIGVDLIKVSTDEEDESGLEHATDRSLWN